MWMAGSAGFFCSVVVTRLLPDSACDKNTIANIVASQKAGRNTAFNCFMILFLFLRASICGFHFRIDTGSQLTLSDSALRRDAAQGRRRNASEFFMRKAAENTNLWQKE